MSEFFKGLKTEFSHIVWPSRKEAFWVTVLVLIISFAVAYYLGALDMLFTWLVEKAIM